MAFLARVIGAAFTRGYGERLEAKALVLETLAAIPAIVIGAIRALRAQRRRTDDALVRDCATEADNEHAHMLAFAAITELTWVDRLVVVMGQPVLAAAFALLHTVSERAAHRLCGHFEEEAMRTYAHHRAAVAAGRPDPVLGAFACERWSLPMGSRLSALLPILEQEESEHGRRHHEVADALRAGPQQQASGSPEHGPHMQTDRPSTQVKYEPVTGSQ